MTTLDKWYMALLLPFGIMLSIAMPMKFYENFSYNDLDNRKAETWTNVFTQVSTVWLFAAIMTTSLKMFACDVFKTERLLMDPSLHCSQFGPILLAFFLLLAYLIGVVVFTQLAVRTALVVQSASAGIEKKKQVIKLKMEKRAMQKKKRKDIVSIKKSIAEKATEALDIIETKQQYQDAIAAKKKGEADDLLAEEADQQEMIDAIENLEKEMGETTLSVVRAKCGGEQNCLDHVCLAFCGCKADETHTLKWLWKLVSWSVEDYRYPRFEYWNLPSRVLIITASTVFLPRYRFYTHIFTMTVSLFVLTACTCTSFLQYRTLTGAYMDSETNMVAILCSIVDILGVLSAWESSKTFAEQGGTPNPVFQVLFIVFLFTVLLVTVGLTVKATCERIQIAHQAANASVRSIWKAWTTCEVILLFPILLIVSFWLVLGKRTERTYRRCRRCCRRHCCLRNKYKVVPTSIHQISGETAQLYVASDQKNDKDTSEVHQRDDVELLREESSKKLERIMHERMATTSSSTTTSTVCKGLEADPDKVQQLCGMGFSEDNAKEALIIYNNNLESACNHLL